VESLTGQGFARMHKRLGHQQDIPLMESGAVLATHTGLGAVAVAVRRVTGETRRTSLSAPIHEVVRERPG
jgi:hypothetical protein